MLSDGHLPECSYAFLIVLRKIQIIDGDLMQGYALYAMTGKVSY